MADEPRSLAPDAAEPFLEGEPPHWAARGLTVIVMVVFAAALIASIVITLPERISSPFVLVPGRGADPIRASRGGVVVAVRITEDRRSRRARRPSSSARGRQVIARPRCGASRPR